MAVRVLSRVDQRLTLGVADGNRVVLHGSDGLDAVGGDVDCSLGGRVSKGLCGLFVWGVRRGAIGHLDGLSCGRSAFGRSAFGRSGVGRRSNEA